MTLVDTFCYVGPDDESDKYRLVRLVGSGGEAALWEAATPVEGEWEKVAVKILRPDHSDSAGLWKNRWSEQVDLLRLIHHPAVVGVHQYFEGASLHRPERMSGRIVLCTW